MYLTPFFRRAEFCFLLGLAFFLPALEAPKNICVGFFLIFWLLNRLRAGDWGGRWTHWDCAILLLIASGYAADLFAGLPGKPVSAGNDLLSYGLVFMTVRRTRFEIKQIEALLITLVLGTLLTLAYGYWGYLVTEERRTLGLHSVGHVNHSAVYMAIVFGLALSAAIAVRATVAVKFALWVVTCFLGVSVLLTAARGAIIPVFAFGLAWLGYWLVHRGASRRQYGWALAVVLATAAVVVPTLVQKSLGKNDLGQVHATGARLELARTALLAAREFPLFGVGPTQFGKVSLERTQQWQSSSRWFADEQLAFGSHAHGLFTNTAAERGLIGLAALLVVLFMWGLALRRDRPGPTSLQVEYVLWGGAWGAWSMIIVGGLFNTTFHHENAMITALLMGLWYSWKRTQTAQQ